LRAVKKPEPFGIQGSMHEFMNAAKMERPTIKWLGAWLEIYIDRTLTRKSTENADPS